MAWEVWFLSGTSVTAKAPELASNRQADKVRVDIFIKSGSRQAAWSLTDYSEIFSVAAVPKPHARLLAMRSHDNGWQANQRAMGYPVAATAWKAGPACRSSRF